MESFFKRKLYIFFLIALIFALAGCGAEEEPQPSVQPPEPTEKTVYSTDIVLSELMASNKTVLTDYECAFCDWIELYNPGSASDISGYWFSDDAAELMKWQIPSLSMAADEYKVIYFSGKDSIGGELHCSFRLPKEGGSLYFSDPYGELVWSISYGETAEDRALRFDGDSQTLTFEATPGFPNTDEGYAAFRAASDQHGALVINEAVLYNDDFNYHAYGYYDWIELKNVSNEAVNLSDYYLTDSSNEPYLFGLPDHVLDPGGLYLIYCGETADQTWMTHAPFSLDAKGDEIYLVSADGGLSDRMGMRDIPLNCSKGRVDGESGFFFFSERTPGYENGFGCARISDNVTASVPEGIYDGVNGLAVELSANGQIFYTTDGSKPTQNSQLYTEAIPVDKTTVIRAVSYEEGCIPSECCTFSYIVNEGHTLPVMSIACDQFELNLLYNYDFWNKIEANCTLFDGDDGFSSECRITLHGTSARTLWYKKNFKIIFSDRYGGDVSYGGFENTDCTEFHSLLLRGGTDSGMQIYRDSLASLVAYDTAVLDPLTLDSKYCILYINGSYWGIFALREAYSEKYGADHTGTEEDGTMVCRAPVRDWRNEQLNALVEFISGKNMSKDENYDYVDEQMDLKSYAQWLCYEAYFNNLDPTGNIRYVKGSTPGSKWKFALFDFDISMGNLNASLSSVLGQESQISAMTNSMRRSEKFRKIVLETASELWANGLNCETVNARFNRLVDQLEPEMERELLRWGEYLDGYYFGLSSQRKYFTEVRDKTWLDTIRSYTQADEETMKTYFPDQF